MSATVDLNKVAVFARVVETKTFTAAARSLGLPKSSISRSVSQLEESLGVRLLQRTTRSVQLTDAGATYYEQVRGALSGLEEAGATVRDLQAGFRGDIRLTAPVDYGVWVLAAPIARFQELHPDVRIELTLTKRIVNIVEEGFDLAVRAGRLRDSALVARKLAAVELGLFASPAYLKRRGMPRNVAALANHDCVLFRPEDFTSRWQLTGPRGTESVTVSGRVAVDDFVFLRELLLQGAGIGLMPTFLCRGAENPDELVRLFPDRAFKSGAASLVYPSSRYVPQRVALFRDFLLAQVGR